MQQLLQESLFITVVIFKKIDESIHQIIQTVDSEMLTLIS